MEAFVNGIGIVGPGLDGWQKSQLLFNDPTTYSETEIPNTVPSFLSASERRRCSKILRIALQVAQEAINNAKIDTKHAKQVATVFASSCGDINVLHKICESLAKQDRLVSPTLFHNSVHNAAAGYWGISTGSRQSSSTLSCFDDSFSAGLLMASAQVSVEKLSVLLVAYDDEFCEPLAACRHIHSPFAIALLLSNSQSENTLAKLSIELITKDSQESQLEGTPFEILRKGNPAARALPILKAIAKQQTIHIKTNFQTLNQLDIGVFPC